MKKRLSILSKPYTYICILFIVILVYITIRYASNSHRSIEGLNELNNSYYYYPYNTTTEVFFNYKINDVIQESIDVLTFLKTSYFHLIDPAKNKSPYLNTNREYSTKITNSEIYKRHNKIVNASTDLLDSVWKPFFIAKTYTPDIMKTFQDEFISYSTDYAYVANQFLNVNPPKNTIPPIDQYSWVNYIMVLIKQYNTNQTKLNELKKWLYTVLLPIEQMSKMIHQYTDNIATYSTKDDGLFIINTLLDTIKNIEFDSILHDADGYLYVFQEEVGLTSDGNPVKKIDLGVPRPLTVDGITLYTIVMMLHTYYKSVSSVIDINVFVPQYRNYLKSQGKTDNTLLLYVIDQNKTI